MLSEHDGLLDLRATVLIIGGEASDTDAVTAAGARGVRCGADDLIADPDLLPLADAVLLTLGEEGLADDRLAQALARLGRPVVACLPRDAIDRATALLAIERCTLLCDPDPVECAAALSLALIDPGTHLNDVASGAEAARLRQLSEEVSRIARVLAGLSGERAGGGAIMPRASIPTPDPLAERSLDANAIRAMLRARRLRAHYFDSELFADPAWDMLLDLMAARIERRPVSVSSLCIAAAVPSTTALRWIKALTDQGLLRRVPDPRDARRVFIELDDASAGAMARCLAAMFAAAPGGVA
ncbi:winged helix DNA-binding protein [Sphingomonas sp. 1P06PA]|uniref:winged helix DNA-binding protein n=1 Tax=Sphingomonas sp. 1P06PA TaxID=554121 RepID=UPI0039A738E3